MIWRIFIAALLACPVLYGTAEAQSARSVLLRICNDTPFDAGVAAAYRTGASQDRTLQGWFMVLSGECLEGGLDGVAGGQLGLHVLSGEWRWPAYEMGSVYCTPADGFRRPGASGPPCGEFERPSRFQPVTINPFRSGWGVVDFRFSCSDLVPADRALCQATPRERDGMAAPVRTLEVCNYDRVAARLALAAGEAGGRMRVQGWQRVEAGQCADVYRGFPEGSRVYVRMLAADPDPGGPVRRAGFGTQRQICHSRGEFDLTVPTTALIGTEFCPPEAPHRASFQEIVFRSDVSRFTHSAHTLGREATP